MKILVVVICFLACVFPVMRVTPDSHPEFTASFMREKSDLVLICKVIGIRRVDRFVANPDREQAFNLTCKVQDILKGVSPKEEQILISHLRSNYANKQPIDFGEHINERLVKLTVGDEVELSRERISLLVYLKVPTTEHGVFTPTSTNHWEHYSIHILSGEFN